MTSHTSDDRAAGGPDSAEPLGLGAGTTPVAGGSADVRAPKVSWRRRLAHGALEAVNRVVPKTPDRIVLHSTVDLEDGVLALADELHARGWTAAILLERPSRGPRVQRLTAGTVRTLPKKSVRGVLSYLTARYVVTTYSVFGDSGLPRSQTLVNIWHGEPAGKVIARFFPGRGGLRCHYAPVTSTVGRAFRSTEFGIHPLRTPILGAARNDRMLRTDAEAVRRALLGEAADRPTFLWLPTFRESVLGTISITATHPGVPFSADDVRRLDDWLVAKGAGVVVKLHPDDAAAFSGEFKAIRLLTQEEMHEHGLTTYTMLPAFDGLLTDVSSVWIDYLLLDKPIVFAFPDIQHYRDTRGLSLEPYEDWVPGHFVRDVEGLIAALDDLVDGRDPMARERGLARLRFHEHRDDRSAARLLDFLGIQPRGPAAGPRPGAAVVGSTGGGP